jgi:hypothetical protein
VAGAVGAVQLLYIGIGAGQMFAAGITVLVRAIRAATSFLMQQILVVFTAL